MDSSDYTKAFYANRKQLSYQSASVVLGDLFQFLPHKSIVDVGCGTGTWLKAALERGAYEVVGVDGDSVPLDLLDVEKTCITLSDLNNKISIEKKFDMAICLEVAEHLLPSRGPELVRDLTKLSDVVLFGAAIPYQIGTGHINCRWQSFWSGLFEGEDFVRTSYIQQKHWLDRRINVVYRQNACIYINKKSVGSFLDGVLGGFFKENSLINVVHPELYQLYLERGLTSQRL
jgi:SAM-dependent methyltransferase